MYLTDCIDRIVDISINKVLAFFGRKCEVVISLAYVHLAWSLELFINRLEGILFRGRFDEGQCVGFQLFQDPEAPQIARDKDLTSIEDATAYFGIRSPGDWPETPRLYPIIEQHILERKGPMRRGRIWELSWRVSLQRLTPSEMQCAFGL